jgi:coproporphyrinogen III oxidase
MSGPAIAPVRSYFLDLQQRICAALETIDGSARFSREQFDTPGGGLARPRVLEAGAHLEKAAVQFTHSVGTALPAAATERNPALAGRGFEAAAISTIVHPRNPYAPTTHMNLRLFLVAGDDPVWYFGGGFDLTPCYGFVEDARDWHAAARAATGAHHADMKAACDRYFVLPHRGEARGVGGIFFDDWTAGGFEASLALVRAVGDTFLPAYRSILERRIDMPYGAREREWQLVRRGRYAEFNLAIDRGTRYGLQSARRIESVLASLPPLVQWRYDHHPETGTPEAQLLTDFLPVRDWLAVDNSGD